jgi:hypothetical protein
VQYREATQLRWGISKLLELGVSEEFVKDLTESQIMDLVKGLLYLREKYSGFGHILQLGGICSLNDKR